MRTRGVLAVIVLALGGIAVACGDEDGDGTGAPDGGSPETVSTSDFVIAADDACTRAGERIDALDSPDSDPMSPDLTAAELEEGAEFTAQLAAIYEELVADLDDMPQPSDPDDAQEANETIDDLGTALERLREVRAAAEAGAVRGVNRTWDEYQAALQTYSEAAQSFGLQACGATS